MCVDFRKRNRQIADAHHPMPTAEALIAEIKDARFFTSLDLAKGYHQIPVDENSSELLFKLNVLPFSIKTATAEFQYIMEGILRDFLGVCVVCISTTF